MKSRDFSFEDKLAQKIVKTNTSTIPSFNLHWQFLNDIFVRCFRSSLQRNQYNSCFGNQLFNLSLWAEGNFIFRKKPQGYQVQDAENSTVALLGSLEATVDSMSSESVHTLLHTK